MSASPNLRLFVAVSVPEGHLKRIQEEALDLRARWPEARWMKRENQHVTLKFLGSTAPASLDDVRTAVASVAGDHRAATMNVSGLGIFPGPRRARVLWVGIDDPEELLASLARSLDEALEPLGYRTEKRAFHPHLTLARWRTPQRIAGDLPELDLDLPAFVVEEVELFRSHLHPKGARYEVLEAFALSPSDDGAE